MPRKDAVKTGSLTFSVMQYTIVSTPCLRQRRSRIRALGLWVLAVACCVGAGSAWASGTLYRCAGKPETYTNQSWAAGRADCRAISGGPLLTKRSAAQPARAAMPGLPRVTNVVHAAAAGIGGGTGADRSTLQVAPMVQSVRDQERKRILEEELSQEQARLAALGETIKQKQAKVPALELAQLSQSSARSESNVLALQRELSRLRP
jgi:hypothetical protein